MRTRIAIILIASLALAACSGGTAESRCDDGGDGGVLIDGICL